jgi:Haloacid dehalogenase-like hydrolase
VALADVRGLLLDIDGTLLVHDRPIPGAAEALGQLRASGLPFLRVDRLEILVRRGSDRRPGHRRRDGAST